MNWFSQYGNDYDRERKEKNDTHDSMLKYVKQGKFFDIYTKNICLIVTSQYSERATVADNKSEQSIQGKTTRLKNQN